METVHNDKKRNLKPTFIAFIVPVMILLLLYIIRGIFPFGDKIYVRMDFYHQYAPFLREFGEHILNGESLLYSWKYGLGTNYWAHFAYYLASPLNWLLVFVPGDLIVEAMNIALVFRAGIAGMGFVYFLKEGKKENMAMAAFGIFYALSGYYLAYSCNVIWMDGYALFPFVAWGILRIAKGKSATVYTISMMISTFSNFYLAVITGVCCILWLIVCLIKGSSKSAKAVWKAIGKFTASTLLYVGICAVILIPTAIALMNTPAAQSGFSDDVYFYFPFYDLLERMCMNVPSNLKGSNLPNIYSSVLILVLLPMYFGNKYIRLKEKIVNAVVLVFLAFGFNTNILDYIWHGLHFPNCFPARQSFFFIFLVLVMGYEAFTKRKRLSKKILYVYIPLLVAALIAAWIFLGKNNEYAGTHIYLCTIVFVLIYATMFLLENKIPKKFFVELFLILCCLEAGINTCVTGLASYVTRSSYLEDDVQTEQILADILPGENEFYRVEEEDRRGINDAGWDGYYGASYFSSTIPAGVKEWYQVFGMRNSSVSYSFDGVTPLTASLLNVRYLFACDDEYYPGNTFTKTEYMVGSEKVYIYENQTVLPLGYMVDESLERQFVFHYGNPFLTMNDYASAVTGEDAALFLKIRQNEVTEELQFDVGAGAESGMEESEESKPKYSIYVPAGSNAFLYVSTYAEEVKLEITDVNTGEMIIRKFDDMKFRKILPLGVEEYDRSIVVSLVDDVPRLSFHSYYMDENVLRDVYEVLNRQPMEVESYSDTKIKGSIDVTDAGVLLLSIPYDAGWKVKVDGIEVETYAWKGAFLALELDEGVHELEFRYSPSGFMEGLVVTIISSVIAVGITIFKIRKKKCTKQCNA